MAGGSSCLQTWTLSLVGYSLLTRSGQYKQQTGFSQVILLIFTKIRLWRVSHLESLFPCFFVLPAILHLPFAARRARIWPSEAISYYSLSKHTALGPVVNFRQIKMSSTGLSVVDSTRQGVFCTPAVPQSVFTFHSTAHPVSGHLINHMIVGSIIKHSTTKPESQTEPGNPHDCPHMYCISAWSQCVSCFTATFVASTAT